MQILLRNYVFDVSLSFHIGTIYQFHSDGVSWLRIILSSLFATLSIVTDYGNRFSIREKKGKF